MADYVIRKRYRGEFIKVDKAIIAWRRERKKKLEQAKAKEEALKLEQDKTYILSKNLFSDDNGDS